MGLSIAEFNALTPSEMNAELEAAAELEKRRLDEREHFMRFLDAHLALAHAIAHNAHFKRRVKVDDYKIMSEKKQALTQEQMAIDAKLRAEARARIAQKRRKEFLQND